MIPESMIDRDGFVKSHAAQEDASNDGVILTVIPGLLKVIDPELVDRAVYACIKNGNLLRRPDNSGGQQSHDGWMALSVWLLYRKNKSLARALLVSAIARGFYMKHTPFELEGKTWKEKVNEILKPALVRYPRIWITLLAAAYPKTFVLWFCSRLILMQTFGTSVDIMDASGVQLQLMDRMAISLMGNKSPVLYFLKELREQNTSIADVMARDFWDPDHVVISGYRNFEQEVMVS